MHVCTYIQVCTSKCIFCVYTGIRFLDLSIERAKKQGTPIAISPSGTQILASNTTVH